jgi:hypothetical protein
MAQSDVSGMPDVPYESGVVVLVPAPVMPELRAAAEPVDAASGEPVGWLQMTEELHERFGAVTATIEPDGRFCLDVRPGDYYVCVGDLGRSYATPEEFPHLIHGWVLTTVGERGGFVELRYDADRGSVRAIQ